MSVAARVAIFTDNDFEKVNGVTTALTAALAGAPPDLRLRLYTASRLGSDTPEYLALPSWGIGIPFYRDMLMYWPPYPTILARLAEDRIDLVHLTTPGPMGLAALAAARRLRLPMVGSFHTDLARYTGILSGSVALETFMRRYMRWLYGHCRQVLVPSQATQALVEASGLPPAKLAVWRRGVDTQVFTPARRSAAQRAEWRAGSDRPVLLYVGRLSRGKGVGLLPALSDGLQRLGLDHRLVIVGDGPLRSELAAACSGAVLPGTLGRDRLAEVYASADLFVFPSATDTAGNVVLEAQASGLPVVVARGGGPPEYMRAGTTGEVCGDGLSAWTTAVGALLADAGRRQAMAGAAREFAVTRSWAQALAPLYDAYRAAVAAPVAAAAAVAGVDSRRVA
ncbi:MAG: glycosyltransferase family 4 protein [Vicinamibacterales bacterium]